MITRRGLFGLLAAAIITPDEFLEEIVKPEKTIILPSWKIVELEEQGIEFSSFLPSLWSDELIKLYRNNLICYNLLQKQSGTSSRIVLP